VLTRKFLALTTVIKKEERSQNNILTFYLKTKLKEKEDQTKLKANKGRE
jgi:hypothetical protein